jgi:phosphopantetheinyl transferase (holo-ACP synthase)
MPTVRLAGAAARRARLLSIRRISVSITHARTAAAAVAIAE